MNRRDLIVGAALAAVTPPLAKAVATIPVVDNRLVAFALTQGECVDLRSPSFMRYSVDSDDPGARNFYELRAKNQNVVVYLDGKEIPEVITADEIEGFVEIYEKDSNGKPIIYGVGNLRRVRLHGNVRCRVAQATEGRMKKQREQQRATA